MLKERDFGVIVICTKKDLLFAKGCCASIKHFMPEAPICLLMDGDFDLEGLDKVYNTFILSRKNIKSEFLKTESFGWGTTRMIAFWESPFEHFLLIDSDVCVWGNLSTFSDFENADVIIDRPSSVYTKKDINEFFFDTDRFEQLNLGFDYSKYSDHFVCPAVLLAKRGCIPLESYKSVLALHNQNPGMFKYGDMGFFNYMMFDLAEKGVIRLSQKPIQYLVPNYSVSEMCLSYPTPDLSPDFTIQNPIVLHWCGDAKPIKKNKKGWNTDIMTAFRTKFYLDAGVSRFGVSSKIWLEDVRWKIALQYPYYKKKMTRFFTS